MNIFKSYNSQALDAEVVAKIEQKRNEQEDSYARTIAMVNAREDHINNLCAHDAVTESTDPSDIALINLARDISNNPDSIARANQQKTMNAILHKRGKEIIASQSASIDQRLAEALRKYPVSERSSQG